MKRNIAIALLLAASALLITQIGLLLSVIWFTVYNPTDTAFMRSTLAQLRSHDSEAQLQHAWVDYPNISDTLKRADAAGRVTKTLARKRLWLAQTPQLFRADPLRAALERAHEQGIAVTDEASAMEAAGYAPRLVPGAACNLKLTWPEDFALMEKLL